MIAHAELLTLAAIGAALEPTVLFEHSVGTAVDQISEQEIGRTESVSEQDIAALQRIEHAAQQRLLVAAAVAFAGTLGGIDQRPLPRHSSATTRQIGEPNPAF